MPRRSDMRHLDDQSGVEADGRLIRIAALVAHDASSVHVEIDSVVGVPMYPHRRPTIEQ